MASGHMPFMCPTLSRFSYNIPTFLTAFPPALPAPASILDSSAFLQPKCFPQERKHMPEAKPRPQKLSKQQRDYHRACRAASRGFNVSSAGMPVGSFHRSRVAQANRPGRSKWLMSKPPRSSYEPTAVISSIPFVLFFFSLPKLRSENALRRREVFPPCWPTVLVRLSRVVTGEGKINEHIQQPFAELLIPILHSRNWPGMWSSVL